MATFLTFHHVITRRASAALALLLMLLATCTTTTTKVPLEDLSTPSSDASQASPGAEPEGIEKIDHLVFIVMENRSFDHYFGTYRGADGLPEKICVPDPAFDGECQTVYHSTDTSAIGGPHTKRASDTAVNGGKMNGFIEAVTRQPGNVCGTNRTADRCAGRLGPEGQPDVMGYHDRDEIPTYWQIADWGVLQDRMFAPADSWTVPAHLFLISGWSAYCRIADNPMSCKSSLGSPDPIATPKKPGRTPYAWTDITYLLTEAGVSWNEFISPEGTCYLKECRKDQNKDQTTSFQHVLPGFTTVKENETLDNIRPYTEFVKRAKAGDLPSVSWIKPAINESDHPANSDVIDGQIFVAEMVNAVTQGPSWDDTAVFIVWDDWGGFYDHVVPPRVDANGYGIRVPGLMLSPYAKKGYIDSQQLTFDAYLKFIEDRFLEGARLDPRTMSRPDSRPTVREEVPRLGNIAKEFNFQQEPRKPPLIKAP